MENGRFRSAVFGGFHRQDVLDFIERSTLESKKRLEERQRAVELLQTTNSSLSGEVALMKERMSNLEATAAKAEELQAQNAALTQERETLASRLEAAQSRLNLIEPDYAQYEAVKSRLSEIELNAHSHAAIIEREAYARTMRVGEQLIQTVGEVQQEYQELKSCAATASVNFRTDLEKILSAMDRFSGFFSEVETNLDHLLAETQSGIRDVSPEPAEKLEPLPEEENPYLSGNEED